MDDSNSIIQQVIFVLQFIITDIVSNGTISSEDGIKYMNKLNFLANELTKK